MIFQSSSFKIDSNRKLPNYGLFWDKQVCRSQTPKKLCKYCIYQVPIFKTLFYKKDAYGKYLPYATLGAYVPCLGAEVFKFPWRLIFGGFSAADEQKPKLVSAHPQIPFWLQKSVMMWNSTFCTIICHFVIVIFRTVSRGQFVISIWHSIFFIQKLLFHIVTPFYFFHKSGSSTLTPPSHLPRADFQNNIL